MAHHDHETPTTRANVCERYGHDVRWKLVIGPMPEGERRPSVQVCLDCGQTWWK